MELRGIMDQEGLNRLKDERVGSKTDYVMGRDSNRKSCIRNYYCRNVLKHKYIHI